MLHFLYLLVCCWTSRLGSFLSILISKAINVDVHIFLQNADSESFKLFICPRVVWWGIPCILALCSGFGGTFTKTPIVVMIICIHQQFIRHRIILYSCQHLSFVFLMMAILIGQRWSLKMVIIFISLMNKDAEQLSKYLWTDCVSSFENYLLSSLIISLIG